MKIERHNIDMISGRQNLSKRGQEGLERLLQQAEIKCNNQAENRIDLEKHKYYFDLWREEQQNQDFDLALSYFKRSLSFVPPTHSLYFSTQSQIQTVYQLIKLERDREYLEEAKQKALNEEKNKTLNEYAKLRKQEQELTEKYEKRLEEEVQKFRDKAQELNQQYRDREDRFYYYLDKGDYEYNRWAYQEALAFYQEAKSIAWNLDYSYTDKIEDRIVETNSALKKKEQEDKVRNQKLLDITQKLYNATTKERADIIIQLGKIIQTHPKRDNIKALIPLFLKDTKEETRLIWAYLHILLE